MLVYQRVSVSKPCACAELLALRVAHYAASTGSAQAGSVRGFQARSEPSDSSIQTDCTALRRGSHPGGRAVAAGQGFGF